MADLLVIGARENSIGSAVATMAEDYGWTVDCAGISGEPGYMDLATGEGVEGIIDLGYEAVVCTAGINEPSSVLSHTDDSNYRHMGINFHGHMRALGTWLNHWQSVGENLGGLDGPLHWVSVSSNSAHIARSASLSYCASKAALSMGLRCAAREMADKGPYAIYGYEPGWIDDTPMSAEVAERLKKVGWRTDNLPLHRIPGGNTMHRAVLADIIVGNLTKGRALNGCMIRLDGGEQ